MSEELYNSNDYCKLAEEFEELKKENAELARDKDHLMNLFMESSEYVYSVVSNMKINDLRQKCKRLEADYEISNRELLVKQVEITALRAEIERLHAAQLEEREVIAANTGILTSQREYEELLNMRNMEADQFNDGFNDARAGKLETDHPHYDLDTDNWRLGYAYGMFEPMKEKLAREHQVSDALYLLLVDDPNTKLKAEQILIDIYGKCEPSPSDVSTTQDVTTPQPPEVQE